MGENEISKNILSKEWVLIIDYGSQYSQLIARCLREHNIYCELYSCTHDFQKLDATPPMGVILSGGPSSVGTEHAPKLDTHIIKWNVPILGICYGMHLLAYYSTSVRIRANTKREYGPATVKFNTENDLFYGIPETSTVWMSHADDVDQNENNDELIISAWSNHDTIAAFHHKTYPWYGIQFHPEVSHTKYGKDILFNFAKRICHISNLWTSQNFINTTIASLKKRIGNDAVICALSGGVDSTVTAYLLHQAIGSQLKCIFVDNGLLRQNEAKQIMNLYKKINLNVLKVDAAETFLKNIENVEDPEQKRKIIGKTFIDVFEKEISQHPEYKWLAQGTLYPDVIESTTYKGPSSLIKSHHNVGGIPKNMRLKVIEPLRKLFKDEVRKIGETLGIPQEFLYRHPFPGPGLAIRIVGKISQRKLNMVRQADAIFIDMLHKHNLYYDVWQAFTVLLPIRSVGVMGDNRTYENTIVLRTITSKDGMTANWAHLPHRFLNDVSIRITNEVHGINRVVYDISSKPPATIEWE